MSYGIVRIQKMGSTDVKGIEIHDRREKMGVSHTNPDIDWERSEQNYDLHGSQNQRFNQFIKNRIAELNLPKAIRKDAVVMAQVLVTSDRSFFDKLIPEQTKQFFKDSYDFLSDRYGKENIISAIVHMDEKTPHMHFNFVPVTSDGRLSAKSIFTRQSLIEQQTAFHDSVGKDYGLERGLQGGKKKHKEVADYKLSTALEAVAKAQAKEHEVIKVLSGRIAKGNDVISKLRSEYNTTKANLATMHEKIKNAELKEQTALKNASNAIQKEQEALRNVSQTQDKVNVLEQKKNSLESQIGVVEARLKAVEQKERTAREALANAQEKERFAEINASVAQDRINVLEEKTKLLQGNFDFLQSKLSLVRENKILNDTLEQIESVVSELPWRMSEKFCELVEFQIEQLEGTPDINHEIAEKLAKIMGEEAYRSWKLRGGNYGR